jgi:hypothetical protein
MTMMRYFRFPMWFCLLWIAPVSLGQVITIRVINANNGHPLPKKHIMVGMRDEKSEESLSRLQLDTDVHGEARFELSNPVPTRLSVVVLLKSRSWRCGCSARVAAQDAVQKGAVEGQNLIRAATPVKAEPGQIVFVARRLPFFERLLEAVLAPLME